MRIINLQEAEQELMQILEQIEKGSIFIYPTDTIYGLGCDATNPKAVQKLRDIKGQQDRPFSVISPNIDWIKENCVVTKEAEDWFKKLPGAYTLILKTKGKNIPKEVNLGQGTIGIRIPDSWIMGLVMRLGKPIITTSVNKTGEEFMINLDTLSTDIKSKCDFIIYDNEINGKPSTIVNLAQEKATIKERPERKKK
ncbi:MAG: L-threonylcarbamoyladenylate synthase [Candidatus Woesearchaeota archaeon]